MPSQKSDFVVRNVFAVREDQGKTPVVVPKPFELRTRFSPKGLLLFTLIVSFAGSSSAQTTVYLHITADFLDSLDQVVYDMADANAQNPPYLDTVRQQLKGMHSITRLQFQLLPDKRIQLAVPKDFTIDRIPDDAALSTFEYVESLATASRFSLYFQHNLLSRDSVPKYNDAIQRSKSEKNALEKAYERMRDVHRLYRGVGGKTHKPRDHHHGPPPTSEGCSPLAPGTPESCGSGSTLPFDVVPPRRGSAQFQRGSPPPYDECLTDGQSPRARSDDAAIFAEDPKGDCDPPKYGDAEEPDDMRDPSQGVLRGGDGDIYIQPIKRKRSPTTLCTVSMSAKDAPRPEKLQRSLFAKSEDAVMHMLKQQQQEIDRLHQMFEESQRLNEVLKRRCDELEELCFKLKDTQDETVQVNNNLDIAVDELYARCDTLETQMPDVCDEMQDLKDKWLEELREEFKENGCESGEDSMAKQIQKTVEGQLNDVKRRIRRALRPV